MPINFNLDDIKAQLRQYHDSGEYEFDIGQKIAEAKKIIEPYIGKLGVGIVIDKDETMVSEWRIMDKYDFGWTEEAIEEGQNATDFPAFEEVRELMQFCWDNGISSYILSSTRERHRDTVDKLLNNAGYNNYSGLILRPNDDAGTIQEFKIRMRKSLVDNGLHVAVNIGDQMSDLVGGYSNAVIKLPNPFYLISSIMVEKHG